LYAGCLSPQFLASAMGYQQRTKCYLASRFHTPCQITNHRKRILAAVLIVLGIAGLLMAGVGFMHSSRGTYSIKGYTIRVIGLGVFFGRRAHHYKHGL